MKKYTLLLLLPLTFLLGRCGMNKQIEQAKALGKCRFELVSADSVYLAGINMKQFEGLYQQKYSAWCKTGIKDHQSNRGNRRH